eukprot:3040041-Pyramimonas_sp.AAC.2
MGVPLWAWKGNRVADLAAKRAASDIPIPVALRNQFVEQRQRLQVLGRFTGAMLEVAGRPKFRDVSK